MLSLAQVKRAYERFRKRYYSDFEMPPAEDIEWSWAEHPVRLGLTEFDEKLSPSEREYKITLHPTLRELPRLMWVILLHEMSHVARNRIDNCERNGKAWNEEAHRLGRLGAMREFF